MIKDKKKIIIETDDTEQVKEEAGNIVRVLSFSFGNENYCVYIKEAKEVLKFTQVTKVPNTPEFILGVINLRGEIIPLIDIRYFLGLEDSGRKQDARVLVTDVGGASVSILVDRIKGTLKIKEASIQPPLATLKGKVAEYTKGQIQLDKEILVFLDLEKILNCEEIKRLKKEGVER